MIKYRLPLVSLAALIGILAVAGCAPSAENANPSAKSGAANDTAATKDNPGAAGQSAKPQTATMDPSK